MIASFVDDLSKFTTVLPILLSFLLLFACAGFGFFIVRMRKRYTSEEEDEVSIVGKRNATILACIGVDLFMIAYVGAIFFLFEFMIEHVSLLP